MNDPCVYCSSDGTPIFHENPCRGERIANDPTLTPHERILAIEERRELLREWFQVVTGSDARTWH